MNRPRCEHCGHPHNLDADGYCPDRKCQDHKRRRAQYRAAVRAFATPESVRRILDAYAGQGFTHVVQRCGTMSPIAGHIPDFATEIATATADDLAPWLLDGWDYSWGAPIVHYDEDARDTQLDKWAHTGFCCGGNCGDGEPE